MNAKTCSPWKWGLFLFILSIASGCGSAVKRIVVTNPLPIDRRSETVAIQLADLKDFTAGSAPEALTIKEAASKQAFVRQLLDYDQDGTPDELIFQVDIRANEHKKYLLEKSKRGASEQPEPEKTTFSRFVPERIDDYAWENDRVAFRTYGPEAQRLVEEKQPGGTLSSGIDLWLKRTPYPVIEKWYAGHLDSAGFYHVDHGEGYDPYHVGASRGTGGAGVWLDGNLLTGKNFIRYRTIATGPIRTVFELDYAPWSPYGIQETKRISLDLGSNFSKFEVRLNAQQAPPNYTLGITLHDGRGEPRLNREEGWFRHWEPIDDSFVGEGIVLDPGLVDDALVHRSQTPDQSQILIATRPPNGMLTYYAGFAWVKSGQVTSVGDWEAMLKKQAQCLAQPLQIKIE
ncbi:MAG: hypothetical protein KIPDCIKN_02636 [Haliscomenobacter sp.]|jgi:hypothetical protein|nr:hypothetical protein [Haliscomenobacter sp.]